jgi:hypothetical protein
VKLLDADVALDYFETSVEQARRALRECEVLYANERDRVLAHALAYAHAKYPARSVDEKTSFAGLLHYLTTGWYGSASADARPRERAAERTIRTMADAAGVVADPNGPRATAKVGASDFTRAAILVAEAHLLRDGPL